MWLCHLNFCHAANLWIACVGFECFYFKCLFLFHSFPSQASSHPNAFLSPKQLLWHSSMNLSQLEKGQKRNQYSILVHYCIRNIDKIIWVASLDDGPGHILLCFVMQLQFNFIPAKGFYFCFCHLKFSQATLNFPKIYMGQN